MKIKRSTYPKIYEPNDNDNIQVFSSSEYDAAYNITDDNENYRWKSDYIGMEECICRMNALPELYRIFFNIWYHIFEGSAF